MAIQAKSGTATLTELSEKQKAVLALRLKKQNYQSENSIAAIEKIQRVPKENYIASYSQKRFWFLDQFSSNKAVNYVHLATKLTGRLDFKALQKTADEILRRHEVLRMVYRTVDDEVYCTFHSNPKCEVRVKKVAALGKQSLKKKINSEILSEITAPFDLAKDIPIRISVLNTGRDEHILIVVMHHIAADMWSLRILDKEMEILYNHYAFGAPLELEPLPVQYLDYAAWQRKRLENTDNTAEIDYWKSALKGAPHCLKLPTDFPRPAVQTYNGATHKFYFPEDLSKSIKKACAQQAVTPFVFMLAAFAVLLSRYSGMNDIVIGSPVAGRMNKSVEKLIGLFINTIAIRIKLTEECSVGELLQRVKKVVGGAMAHQEYPFEKLVRELETPQNLSYTPVFQAMFNYQSIEKNVTQFSGMQAESVLPVNNTAKFDINLAIKHMMGGIIGQLTYNTDLFLPQTIERITKHYLNVLRQMTASSEISFAQLELLDEHEKETIINNLSRTQKADYRYIPYFHRLFEEQAEKTPNATAIVCDGRFYTYGELNARANKLAGYLQKLGISPEKCVGLFLERSLELVVGILGILKAGGAYVPLDPIFPDERMRHIIYDAKIEVVVTQQSLSQGLCNMASLKLISLDSEWDAIENFPAQNPDVGVLPDNLMYVLYTSGSTGKPKGVEVEHKNYINYYFGIMQRLKLENGLKYAIASTFAADLATINLWAALNTGGQLHILSRELSADPQKYANYFKENAIDVIKMVPSHFKSLQEGANLKDIIPNRCLILAGEASYWGMIDEIRRAKPQTEVQIHYGPTETTVSMLTYKVAGDKPAQHTQTLPLGRPIANVCIYVLDEKMRPVPIGVAGELYIGGAGVARGYRGNSQLTNEKFIANPFEENAQQRLYKSGDSVRMLSDGTIEFLGRVDEQVKVHGYRIEPGEITAALKEFDGIGDAFAAVKENQTGEKIIIGYFTRKLDVDISCTDVRAFLRSKLPHYMVPAVLIELEKMPLNANGKVNRDALPMPESFTESSDAQYEMPSSQAEHMLVQAWQRVLKIEKVGITDNFFCMGGDSFKAVQVIREFGGALSIMDIFKYPTIKELAHLLAESKAGVREVLYKITRQDDKEDNTALICVPFAGGSAIAYKELAEALGDNIVLYAVQVPGHDFSQHNESLQPIELVARLCVQEIKQKVAAKRLVVYGHCLGGALAIEIARLLHEQGFELAGVFMGGNFPVSELPGSFFKLWNKLFPRDRRMSNRAYIDMLRSLGGFAEQLSSDERDFIIKSLRHDRRESERYFAKKYAESGHTPMPVPMLCVVGEMDRTTEFYTEQYHDWEYFCEHVDVEVIPNSGHYFFKHQAETLSKIIEKKLSDWQQNISVRQSKDEHPVQQKAVKNKRRQNPEPSIGILFIFIIGQFVSLVGSSLSGFAMGVWVYGKTGATMDFAATLIFSRLPGILMLPIAGVIADKLDRRHILIVSNLCSALVTILLAMFFYQNSLEAYHIYIAAAVKSVANAFQRPAYLAAVAQITPKRYLGQANGIVQLSTSLGEILAPMLGGVLVLAWSLSGIILLDFFTFLFCIATLLAIHFPNALYHREDETFLQQMSGGWSFICKRKSFVALVIYFAVSNLMLGMANVLVTPLVLTFQSTVALGMVTSATGLGGLAGGAAMSLWGGARRRSEGMIGFGFLIGISYIIMGLRPNIRLVVAGVFVYGVSMALVNAHWQTLIQSKVRAELLARVFSINQLFALPSIPLGYFLGGLLSDNIFKPLFAQNQQAVHMFGWLVGGGNERGIGLLFISIGLCMALWSIIGYQYKPLRYMDDILPDAMPGAVFISDKDKLQQLEDQKLEMLSNGTK